MPQNRGSSGLSKKLLLQKAGTPDSVVDENIGNLLDRAALAGIQCGAAAHLDHGRRSPKPSDRPPGHDRVNADHLATRDRHR